MKMLMLGALCAIGLMFSTGCKCCSKEGACCKPAASACNGDCCKDPATCAKCCTDAAGCAKCCKKS